MGGRGLGEDGRSVLVDFCHLDTNLDLSGRRKSLLRKCLRRIAYRQVCRAFSWFKLMWEAPDSWGQCHTQVGGPGWYRKAGWASLGCKPVCSVLGLLLQALPWFPSMDSGYVCHPFLPKAAFGDGRHQGNRKKSGSDLWCRAGASSWHDNNSSR